jgi:hypothetical protein
MDAIAVVIIDSGAAQHSKAASFDDTEHAQQGSWGRG